MQSNNIDMSKYKLLTDYIIDIRANKGNYKYYSSILELLNNKFAMVEENRIDLFKNDSLDIIYSIKINIVADEKDLDESKMLSLYCLQNGSLMVSTFDGKLYTTLPNNKYKIFHSPHIFNSLTFINVHIII